MNLRRVIHGSGLRAASLVVSSLIGFLLMPYLVHHLGDRDYGFWTLAGVILGYYGVLDFGILSAVQFYVAKALGNQDVRSANQTISTAFYAFAILGGLILVVTIVLAAFAHWIVKDASQVAVFRAVLLIMGLGFATGFPGRAFLGAMCAHMRWDVVSQFGMGALLLRSGLIFLAVRSGGGLISLAAITVLADFLVYAGYYFVLRKIQRPFVLSMALTTRESFKQIVGYSAFTFVAKVGDQLRFYVNSFVVGAFITVGAVTHYAVASRLTVTYMELMVAILGLLAPWFSLLLGNGDHVEIKRVFVFGTKVSAFLATTIASLLIVYSKPFISAWMGDGYLDAFWPLLLLTLAVLADVSQLPSVSFLYGVYRHRFLAYLTLAEGIANAALAIYLAPKYGMVGVALGAGIPLLIAKVVIQPVYVCRHIGLSLREYYFGILGRAMGFTALALFLPAFFLSNAFAHPNLIKIGFLVAGQLCIAAIAGYLTVFRRDERKAILRSLVDACRLRVKEPVELVLETPKV